MTLLALGLAATGFGAGLAATSFGVGLTAIGFGAGLAATGLGAGLAATGLGAGLAATGLGAGLTATGLGAGLAATGLAVAWVTRGIAVGLLVLGFRLIGITSPAGSSAGLLSGFGVGSGRVLLGWLLGRGALIGRLEVVAWLVAAWTGLAGLLGALAFGAGLTGG